MVLRGSEALSLASQLVSERNVLDGGKDGLSAINDGAVKRHLRGSRTRPSGSSGIRPQSKASANRTSGRRKSFRRGGSNQEKGDQSSSSQPRHPQHAINGL